MRELDGLSVLSADPHPCSHSAGVDSEYKGSDTFVESGEVSQKTYEWLRLPGLRSRTDSAK